MMASVRNTRERSIFHTKLIISFSIVYFDTVRSCFMWEWVDSAFVFTFSESLIMFIIVGYEGGFSRFIFLLAQSTICAILLYPLFTFLCRHSSLMLFFCFQESRVRIIDAVMRNENRLRSTVFSWTTIFAHQYEIVQLLTVTTRVMLEYLYGSSTEFRL